MKYLLDTHTFLWCFQGSDKLGEKSKSIIRNANTQKFISVASLWEFSIKHSLEKLKFDGGIISLCTIINQNGFTILPITQANLEKLSNLPFIHNDPFDRMIVATAKTEGFTILTADKNIRRYDVSWDW